MKTKVIKTTNAMLSFTHRHVNPGKNKRLLQISDQFAGESETQRDGNAFLHAINFMSQLHFSCVPSCKFPTII